MTTRRNKSAGVVAAAMRRPALAAAIDRYSRLFDQIDTHRIAVAMNNGMDWLAIDLAALATNRVTVPLPSFFSHDQRQHVIESSGVDTLLLHDIAPFGPASRFTGFRICGQEKDITWLKRSLPGPPDLPRGTFKISYTSGSTGRPKGACLGASMLETVATSLVERTRDLGIQRHLSLLPLAVLLENIAGAWTALLSDAELHIPDLAETGLNGSSGLDPSQLAACLQKYQPESIIVLPHMLEVLRNLAANGILDPSGLKFVAVGGAHTPLPLLHRARKSGMPVYEGYGMTECGSVVCLNVPGRDLPGSVGRPLAHIAVRTSNSGELRLSGPHHLGYVGVGPAEKETDHAFPSGDLGRVDSDGFVHVAGRIDNRYSTAWGRNISPEWIESVLNGQPEIAQCFVHGRDLAFNIAIIVPAGSDPAQVDRAVDRCNRELPDYARIARWQIRNKHFAPDDGTTTPNGRLRREAIFSLHRNQIEELISMKKGKTA